MDYIDWIAYVVITGGFFGGLGFIVYLILT